MAESLPTRRAFQPASPGSRSESRTARRRSPRCGQRIQKYRRVPTGRFEDHVIGCILLEQPFWLPPPQWIPVPEDWKPNIVQGKTYDVGQLLGRAGRDSYANHRPTSVFNSVSTVAPFCS